jgi:hypothetical protein
MKTAGIEPDTATASSGGAMPFPCRNLCTSAAAIGTATPEALSNMTRVTSMEVRPYLRRSRLV